MYPRPKTNLTARSVEGETVLLHRAGGFVHQLNNTASFIWSRLDGHTSPHDVAAAVAEAFDVEPEKAARDVDAFVDQLKSLDLLELDVRGVE